MQPVDGTGEGFSGASIPDTTTVGLNNNGKIIWAELRSSSSMKNLAKLCKSIVANRIWITCAGASEGGE